jgi:hypothetical protein
MTETKTVFTGENAALEFDNLDVKFRTEFGTVHAVKGLSLTVEPGEVMALASCRRPRGSTAAPSSATRSSASCPAARCAPSGADASRWCSRSP